MAAHRLAALGALAAIFATGASFAAPTPSGAEPASVPLVAPVGVTFQQTRTGGSPIQAPAVTTVLADPSGKPLAVYEKDMPGKPTCLEACATAHPPFEAPAGALPQGDWSIIVRADGVRQWAVRGAPVYQTAADSKETADAGDWKPVPLQAGSDFRAPVGIFARPLEAAAAIVLVDRGGRPIYTFSGDAWADKSACLTEGCARRWTPVTAPQLGRPIGDFTVISHHGVFQWAYQGRPLFTFEGDLDPGEMSGATVDARWQPVMLARFFMPPGVVIGRNHFDGPVLATGEGKTLYFRDRTSYQQGHSLRVGTRPAGANGKLLGTKTCEGECLKEWQPLAASADAQAAGYWNVVDRPEGQRQWAYHGFPVYTYAGDKVPGDMNGYDQFVILQAGDLPPVQYASPLQPRGVDGLVWRAAAP